MTFFKKNTLLILLTSCSFQYSIGQNVHYQDVFYGGVTGDGYEPINSVALDTLSVHIESGSSIRKAYLYVSLITLDKVIDRFLFFDGTRINLSYNGETYHTSASNWSSYVLAVDVTQYVSPNDTLYTIEPPINQNITAINGLFSNFYLLITYDNLSLGRTSVTTIVNTQNTSSSILYTIASINNPVSSNDIGFSFNGNSFCDTFDDGGNIYVDNTFIGLVGGDESAIEPTCSGVRGAFYYQDSTLFGLDNDVANITMNGVDALADISSYIVDPTNFTVRFDHQNIGGPKENSNLISELFLAYTTPCDTFSVTIPSDTIICQGTQLQLNVTGGQKYEWLPSTGLSCDTCANPIFSADSSMNYTVRIWNNDSCSVVHPLQILVSQPRIDTLLISPPTCGTSDGEIAVNASSFSWFNLSYSSGGAFQTDSVLSNLTEGNITVTVQDELGCWVDSTFFLAGVNNTNALFTVNPPGGEDVPLVVWANSVSQNANQFEWWVDGNVVGSGNEQYYTFNTSGAHEIMLIAWQYDPNCADTSVVIIEIKRKVVIPTAFTPDGDGINDFWEILYLDELYPQNKVFVYNRWGNLVYESEEGKYDDKPWAAVTDIELAEMPVGSYFYVIKTGGNEEDFTGSVTIVR